MQHDPEAHWQVNWLKSRIPWQKPTVRPAEISDELCRVLVARENILEDADYNKILPNHFIVEIAPEDYHRYFELLEQSLIRQWRDRLLQHIATTNSRLGRKECRLEGQLLIEIHSVPGVKINQARILCRVEPGLGVVESIVPPGIKDHTREIAFLELIGGHRRWPLYPGDNTIGRDAVCDVFLDLPIVQEKRLISAHHAIIRIGDEQSLLIDGSPAGKPSANGTYLNSRAIPMGGALLNEGDIIILAAINPRHPRLNTPGVAAFRYRKVRFDT